MSDNHHTILMLLREMSATRILTVPRLFIDYIGNINGALLLSQILYWSDRGKDGMFYKTYGEWKTEICLSKKQVMREVKRFRSLGIITTTVKKENGAPTLHYKLNVDVLVQSIVNFVHGNFPKGRKGTIEGVEKELSKESSLSALSSYRDDRDDSINNTVRNSISDSVCSSSVSPAQKPSTGNGEDELVPHDGLIPRKEKSTDATNFDMRCADELAKGVAAKLRTFKQPSLAKWADAFRLLRTKDGFSKDVIKEMLLWYIPHIGDAWMVEAFCGDSFREAMNNNKLSAARQRVERDTKRAGGSGDSEEHPEAQKIRGLFMRTFGFTARPTQEWLDKTLDEMGIPRGAIKTYEI